MLNESNENEKPKGRGIYLLPNLFTVMSLFAGFYSIVMSIHNYFASASVAIFLAMLMDALDGRIARLTNTVTEFGAQLDSLCDMVSFGIAPALLLYMWSLHSIGKPGWLAAFVYAVCNALRLARFNTQLGTPNKHYFQGLATTASAGAVAGLVWLCAKYHISGILIVLPVAVVTVLLALLQVSTIRYSSFKNIGLKGRVSFIFILIAVLIIVLISFDAPLILFLVFFIYALSGPVMTIWGIHVRRKRHRLHLVKQK